MVPACSGGGQQQSPSSFWAYVTADGAGVAKDAELAVSWYLRAADAGHTEAQFSLGMCYANGTGVAIDGKRAILWYRRAAEAGHAYAQRALRWVEGLPTTS